MARLKVDLMLDSGAFSAWKRREVLDLQLYIDYCLRNKDRLYSYVSLDVIPGVFGQALTRETIEGAADKSYDNHQVMKEAGLEPIPVFHQGEDFSALARYLDDDEPYIGISPRDDLSDIDQDAWLAECYTIICRPDGSPVCKTHGFGVTTVPFLLKYPFTTSDSTRWSVEAGFGRVLIPADTNGDGTGDYKYDKPPITIAVSQVPSDVNDRTQLERMRLEGEVRYAYCAKYLIDELGLSFDALRFDNYERRRVYLHYYEQLGRTLGNSVKFDSKKWVDTFDTNFRKLKNKYNDRPAIAYDRLRVFFATPSIRDVGNDVMTDMGVRTRLLSYYLLRDVEDSIVDLYVNKGTLKSIKKKIANPRAPKLRVAPENAIQPKVMEK